MPASKKYDAETQARAVRMYADRIAHGDISLRGARREVGELLGINQSTLRNWIRRDLGEGMTPAAGSGEPRRRSGSTTGPVGFTPPGSWPKACDLLPKADMRAILPDITQLTQESGQLRFSVRTPDGISRGERRIPVGHCRYIYYLAGTETQEFKESYKGWLNVTVDLAGDPDIVEANYRRMAHGMEADAPAVVTCVDQSTSEYFCRTEDLAFRCTQYICPTASASKANPKTTSCWERPTSPVPRFRPIGGRCSHDVRAVILARWRGYGGWRGKHRSTVREDATTSRSRRVQRGLRPSVCPFHALSSAR
jgi:hypothetical protein